MKTKTSAKVQRNEDILTISRNKKRHIDKLEKIIIDIYEKGTGDDIDINAINAINELKTELNVTQQEYIQLIIDEYESYKSGKNVRI